MTISRRQIYKALLRMPEMNYIQQHDNGYVVIFKYPKTQKIMAAKSFDFVDYIDGPPETLYWAKEWRDKKYTQLLKCGLLKLLKEQAKKKRTWLKTEPKETGVVHDFHEKGTNETKEAFIVSWYEKRRTKKGYIIQDPHYEVFAVGEYGRNQAKTLADALWIQKKELASISIS